MQSCINIAKCPRSRIQQIIQPLQVAQPPQINHIIQRGIPRRRRVTHGHRAGHNMSSVSWVEVLPDPEYSIDHAMVEEEHWVSGGNI